VAHGQLARKKASCANLVSARLGTCTYNICEQVGSPTISESGMRMLVPSASNPHMTSVATPLQHFVRGTLPAASQMADVWQMHWLRGFKPLAADHYHGGPPAAVCLLAAKVGTQPVG
jgi:hypothetical protein